MIKFTDKLAAFAVLAILFAGCSKEDPDIPELPVSENGLPTLHIYTLGGNNIKSKTEWQHGATLYLCPPSGGSPKKLGTARVKGRGNASWSKPKKPISIDLDRKTSLLGMPEGSRFDLLANYYDITDMRNAVAFEIGRRSKGFDWSPNFEFVELYLNEKYMGNYLLTEHIEISDNRLNLKEGGYILEFDKYFDEQYKFRTYMLDMPVMLKDYRGTFDNEIFDRITDSICYLEMLLYMDDRETNGWQDHIDMDSFIDWWFQNELVQNGEPNHPKSSFMYRNPSEKLKAGPGWDFDWNTFRGPDNYAGFIDQSCIWYKYLFMDKNFVKRVKEKWEESKDDFKSVADYIEEIAAYIRESAIQDREQWTKKTGVNSDENLSFDQAVTRMKSGYLRRWEWMDKQISAM